MLSPTRTRRNAIFSHLTGSTPLFPYFLQTLLKENVRKNTTNQSSSPHCCVRLTSQTARLSARNSRELEKQLLAPALLQRGGFPARPPVTAAGQWRRPSSPCRRGSRRAGSTGLTAWSRLPSTGCASRPSLPEPARQWIKNHKWANLSAENTKMLHHVPHWVTRLPNRASSRPHFFSTTLL